MLPSEDFLDRLVATDLGRITASNLLSGLHLGLYDRNLLWAVLIWWESLVNFLGYKGDEIVAALRKLPELALGHYPSGFSPPRSPRLPDLLITCRRERFLGLTQHVASVREAQTLVTCGHPDDLKQLSAAGIDLTARPGSRSYGRSLQKSWEGRPYKLRLAPGPGGITRPDRNNLAILWFTPNAPLHARLKKVGDAQKADAIRDVLGLVHFGDNTNLAMVSFPSTFAEQRVDRGRPTFIEAAAHRRFKCRMPDECTRPFWGRAADLAKLQPSNIGKISGYLERICGRVPATSSTTTTDPLVMNVRFIGAAQVPRKDFDGTNDKEFADLLQSEVVLEAGGTTLRDQLLALRR